MAAVLTRNLGSRPVSVATGSESTCTISLREQLPAVGVALWWRCAKRRRGPNTKSQLNGLALWNTRTMQFRVAAAPQAVSFLESKQAGGDEQKCRARSGARPNRVNKEICQARALTRQRNLQQLDRRRECDRDDQKFGKSCVIPDTMQNACNEKACKMLQFARKMRLGSQRRRHNGQHAQHDCRKPRRQSNCAQQNGP